MWEEADEEVEEGGGGAGRRQRLTAGTGNGQKHTRLVRRAEVREGRAASFPSSHSNKTCFILLHVKRASEILVPIPISVSGIGSNTGVEYATGTQKNTHQYHDTNTSCI